MPLSPAAAAKFAGVSRPTITRAIESGALHALKMNDSGYWSIEEAELERWRKRALTRDRAPAAPATPAAAELDEVIADLAAERLRAETAERELALAGDEVSRLRQQLDIATLRCEHAESREASLQSRLSERDAELARQIAVVADYAARLTAEQSARSQVEGRAAESSERATRALAELTTKYADEVREGTQRLKRHAAVESQLEVLKRRGLWARILNRF